MLRKYKPVFSSHFIDLCSINSPSQVKFIWQRKVTNLAAIDLKMTTVKTKKPSRDSGVFLFRLKVNIYTFYSPNHNQKLK